MDYVRLGKTGLKVSRLCLGAMTYGTPVWRPWVLDDDASRPFVTRALEHGINFFDTADMYSRGASEEVLGRALKDFARRDADFAIVDRVAEVAGDRGVKPTEVALAWLLARPGVTAPIVGASKLAHLDDAIAALDVRLEVGELAFLEEPYQPHPVLGHS